MKTVVCISDLHGQKPTLPQGDILLICGDLTENGTIAEFVTFQKWVESERWKFKHVVVIPGNHDHYVEKNPKTAKIIMGNVHLLINESVDLDGIKVWGSPYIPEYGSKDSAFCIERGKLKDNWDQMPNDIDFLLTHCPPRSILDRNKNGELCGCKDLTHRIMELPKKPKLHVFGHIHESRGQMKRANTLFVNACALDKDKKLHLDIIRIRI